MKMYTTAVAALIFVLSFTTAAQKSVQTSPGTGGSPHFRTEWVISGAHISIEYGRPYLKGRTIGKDVVPYGEPWRTGADEATIITSDKLLKFGQISLPPGTYTINTLPAERGWELILGKLSEKGQWGIPYQPQLEIGRTPMKVGKTNAPVEQETISIDPAPSGGIVRIEWGTTSVTISFTVP